jgi:hypothetical protein
VVAGASDIPVRKKHKKQEDEVSKLEKQVRELKAINRSLMKQLKKLSRGIHKDAYDDALDEVFPVKEEKKNKCPECTRGSIIETNVAGRIFHRCSICSNKAGPIKK